MSSEAALAVASTPVLEEDARWQAIQRVVKTESFAKASRLSSFLLYICERTLLGRMNELTEYQIGLGVFDRQSGYNPSEDNIVRQTARQLRQRLALFYQEEGKGEQIRVLIPRGAYIPQFVSYSDPVPSTNIVNQSLSYQTSVRPEAEEPAATRSIPAQARKSWLLWISICFVLLLLVCLTAFKLHSRSSPSEKLWRALFRSGQKVLLVPGDAALNVFENLDRRQVDVREYAGKRYLETPAARTPSGYTWSSLASRIYTPVSDLRLIAALMRLKEVDSRTVEIRFARDLRFEDLSHSNLVLIGSANYDPWVQMFDAVTDFHMKYDGVRNTIAITNSSPRKNEVAMYEWAPTDPVNAGYGIITLTDNLSGRGKVLLVEGTTMSGTQTSIDFLLDEKLMDPVLARAMDGSGRIANYEILLGTTLFPDGALKGRVLAFHVHSRP